MAYVIMRSILKEKHHDIIRVITHLHKCDWLGKFLGYVSKIWYRRASMNAFGTDERWRYLPICKRKADAWQMSSDNCMIYSIVWLHSQFNRSISIIAQCLIWEMATQSMGKNLAWNLFINVVLIFKFHNCAKNWY